MDGTKLSNLAGITLPGNWDIPYEGSIGNVRNMDTNKVLGVNATGTGVIEDYLLHSGLPLYSNQQWEIVVTEYDNTSYFTIKSRASGKILQASTEENFTIEGTCYV